MAEKEFDYVSLEGKDASVIPLLKKEEQRLRGLVEQAQSEAKQLVTEAEQEARVRVEEAEKQIPADIDAERKRETARIHKDAEEQSETGKAELERLERRGAEKEPPAVEAIMQAVLPENTQ